MTAPLDRLRQIAAERRRLDDEEAEILDTLETASPTAPCAPARRPGRRKILNIGQAERVTGMSRTWIYTLARRRKDIGWKSEIGWRFDEEALRTVCDPPPCAISAICEISAGEPIPPQRETPYLLTFDDEGSRHE